MTRVRADRIAVTVSATAPTTVVTALSPIAIGFALAVVLLAAGEAAFAGAAAPAATIIAAARADAMRLAGLRLAARSRRVAAGVHWADPARIGDSATERRSDVAIDFACAKCAEDEGEATKVSVRTVCEHSLSLTTS